MKANSWILETLLWVTKSRYNGSIDEFNRRDRHIFPHTVNPVSKPLLCFVHQGKTLQFRALPFGLLTSPNTFTKIMKLVVDFTHLHGVKNTPILGRLATDSRKPSNRQTTDIMAPTALQSLRPSSKPCRINTNPITTDNISGYSDRQCLLDTKLNLAKA